MSNEPKQYMIKWTRYDIVKDSANNLALAVINVANSERVIETSNKIVKDINGLTIPELIATIANIVEFALSNIIVDYAKEVKDINKVKMVAVKVAGDVLSNIINVVTTTILTELMNDEEIEDTNVIAI